MDFSNKKMGFLFEKHTSMNIKKKTVNGAWWMFISTVITSIVQLLRLSVLTHYLQKADFGIVAIITFVLGLTYTFTDLGFSSAIIYKQDLERKDFSSLFWIQLIVFSILYIAISLISPIIADFYTEPSISYLMPLTLLDLLLQGIGKLYDSVLQKEFKFKEIALRNIFASVTSLIFAYIFAINGAGIYSLILSTLLNTTILNVTNFILGQKQFPIAFYINLKKSSSLMKVGFYLTGTQILDYLSSKLDVMIIGKFLGTEALGIYNLSKEILYKVIILINTIGNKVSLPLLAKAQNDISLLSSYYKKILHILTSINIPIIGIIFVLSLPIVELLYGNDYIESATVISILSLWAIISCIANPQGLLTVATGRTNLSFNYTIVRIIISLPIVIVSSMLSLKAIAWGQCALAFIMMYFGWKMQIYKIIKLPFKDYMSVILPKVLINSIVVLLIFPLMNFLSLSLLPIFQIIIYSIIYIILYILLYAIIRYKDLKSLVLFFVSK